MGCSDSKEKTPPPPPPPKPVEREAKPVEKPKPVETPKPVEQPKPVEEPVEELPPPTPQEDAPPAPTAADLRSLAIKDAEKGRVACFPDGLVYRCQKDGAIYYHNETVVYEAHVTYTFPAGATVTAGPETKVTTESNGSICAFCIVYPMETVEVVRGSVKGAKVKVTLEPLSEAYLMGETGDALAEADEATRKVESFGLTDLEDVLRKCVQTGTPFVDIDFPPKQESIARPGIDSRKFPPIAFRRPTQYLREDLRDQSNDIVGPIAPAVVQRGFLGDCWVTCAASIMANNEALIKQLFAYGNPSEKKIGAYRVLVQKNGWFQKLIVDNFLPTRSRSPVFACSKDDPRELWVSLFEKAYAKVNGSYAAITGGDALQVLQDFTGAPVYRFDEEWATAAASSDKAREFAALLGQNVNSNIIVFSTPKEGKNLEAIGLRPCFTYLVDRIEPVNDTVLFHIINPWGLNSCWKGAWGEGSPEWKRNIDAKLRCKPSWNKPGEFWMAWEDVKEHFNGGGIVFSNTNDFVYSVKGMFQNYIPSAVLEITAKEAAEVTLTLTQRDRRGIPLDEPDAIQGAIMLSVAAEVSENRQQVQCNTTRNPVEPSDASTFDFVADRAVTMKYTFEPGRRYFVVPRLHQGFVEEEHQREYVISIASTSSLEGKINAEVKQLPAENRVYRNLISFTSADAFNVEAEQQICEHFDPKSRVSSVLVAA